MAAWSRDPEDLKKVALVVGGGLVVSGAAYVLWRSLNQKEQDDVKCVEIGDAVPQNPDVDRKVLLSDSDDGSSEEDDDSAQPTAPSSDEVPPIKKGYLTTLELKGERWCKYFYELDGENLTYYESEEDFIPDGIVKHEDIIEANICDGVHADRENVFELRFKSGIFHCQAPSTEDRDAWIAAFNSIATEQPLTEAAAETPEPPIEEVEKKDSKIVMLGLDGSGKSSILAKLSHQEHNPQVPSTDGFNVMCVQTEEVSLNIWEIGGKPATRQYWPNFVADANVLVFVIDAADYARMNDSAAELKKLLSNDQVKSLPLVVIAHKQDRRSAISAKDLKGFLEAEILYKIPKNKKEIHYIGTEAMSENPATVMELQNLLIDLTT